MLARPHARDTSRFSIRAFTLIELLVVIAIIALLISILLPALGEARKAAQCLREQAGASQTGRAYMVYSNDNRDATMTGYIPWSVGHLSNKVGPLVWLHPDPFNPQHMVEGNVIKVAGLRFLGATGLPAEAAMMDRATFRSFQSRPLNPTYNNNFSPPTVLYDGAVTERPAAYAYHSSIGLNYVYVGGSASQGAFVNYNHGTPDITRARIGHTSRPHYVTKVSDVIRTDKLLLGTSARGVDVASIGGWTGSGNYWGGQNITWSASMPVVPGFWTVLPPSPQYAPGGATGTGGGGTPVTTRISWVASNKFVKNSNPLDWGYVDPRCSGKAISLMMDGHVELFTLQQLRDMRRWANQADSANWTYRP